VFTVFCYTDISNATSWYDYLKHENPDHCGTQEAVDWLKIAALSVVPFTGFSSFYVGKIFDGAFELAHGFFTLILYLAYKDGLRSKHSEDSGFGECMTMVIVVMDLIKVVVDFNTGRSRIMEIVLIAFSFILGCCAWEGQENVKVRRLSSALALTASLGVMEWIRHISALILNIEVDVNGCLLIYD